MSAWKNQSRIFRGKFARYLNQTFPNRKLNLFDTFEGFAETDLKSDVQNNFFDENFVSSSVQFLKQTQLDLVMSKMKYPEQIEIHKGFFPDTIPSEEKRFALVSLDTDIYPPMLAGLEYFYPRLSNGGYILLHDYSGTSFSRSIRKAVEDFEEEFGHISKVPLGDFGGTLIITK